MMMMIFCSLEFAHTKKDKIIMMLIKMMTSRIFCSFEFAHTSGQVFLLVTIHLGRRTSDASLTTMMMITIMVMMIKDKYDFYRTQVSLGSDLWVRLSVTDLLQT